MCFRSCHSFTESSSSAQGVPQGSVPVKTYSLCSVTLHPSSKLSIVYVLTAKLVHGDVNFYFFLLSFWLIIIFKKCWRNSISSDNSD